MKTNPNPHRRVGAIGALVLPLALFTAHAKHDPAAAPDQSGMVRVSSADTPGRSVSHFVGRPVRTVQGEQLGTIEDVVVDAYTGRILYAAVVASDGETRRLVPFEALQDGRGNTLIIDVEPAQWRKISPIEPRDFDAGRITLTAGERRQLARGFGQPEEEGVDESPADAAGSVSDDSIPDATRGGSHLVRLGDLRGRGLTTGTETIGTIDDVVIEADRMMGAAVVGPARDLSMAQGRKFLVPLRQLNLAARDQDPVTTTLLRADFEKAQRLGSAGGPGLSPTGRDTDDEVALSAASITAIMEAVQQAIAGEPSSSASVHVGLEDGKLLLRGSVPNQALKERIERTVRQSAPDAEVDNQLRVEAQ